MKRLLSVLAVVFSVGLAGLSLDAEAAKRLGSGKSMGTQRQATADKAPATPATQAAAPAAAGAAPAAAAAPSRSWMGPVAGLAAGLGIAALASHLGFGEELASMVMIGLLVAAVMLVVGLVLRKRAAQRQGGMAPVGGMMPATAGAPAAAEPPATAYKSALQGGSGASSTGSLIGSALGAAAPRQGAVPADFDRAGFERNAKVNFIRLQAAYDAGNLEDIRGFTTPEMFAELKLDFAERDPGQRTGDVARLDADVVEVVEEGNQYLVSVKFTGFIRYGAGIDDETFDEIWHLTKPRDGQGGWVLAGIQQVG